MPFNKVQNKPGVKYWVTSERKQEFQDRMVEEGKWNDFCERKQVLVEMGNTKQAAKGIAETEFGRRAGHMTAEKLDDDRTKKNEEVEYLDEEMMMYLAEKDPTSRAGEAQWVYQHIYALNVDWVTAPSSGAWGWLQSIRADPDMRADFYSKVWPSVIKSKVVDSASEGHGRGEESSSDDIVSRLRGLKGDAEESSIF